MADAEPPGVVHFRVDPRFVHATLMNAWVPFIGANRIIVADAGVCEDQRQRTILEMSAMDAVSVDFTTPADLSEVLAHRSEADIVIALFASLADAERALDAGVRMAELNVGHVPEGPGRRARHPSVHLGDVEQATIERMERGGTRVIIQPLPKDPAPVPDSPPRDRPLAPG